MKPDTNLTKRSAFFSCLTARMIFRYEVSGHSTSSEVHKRESHRSESRRRLLWGEWGNSNTFRGRKTLPAVPGEPALSRASEYPPAIINSQSGETELSPSRVEKCTSLLDTELP